MQDIIDAWLKVSGFIMTGALFRGTTSLDRGRKTEIEISV